MKTRLACVMAAVMAFFSTFVLAQDPQMMEKLREMQICMDNVDKAALKQIETRARAFDAEIKALCESGKRAAALQKAMAFGLEMRNDKAVKQMRACTEGLKDIMPQMVPTMPFDVPDEKAEESGDHICDH